MRGLPPLPSDFFTLQLQWLANEQYLGNVFHIFAPGASSASPLDLSNFIGDWFTNALPELLAITPANATVTACRLSTSGPSPVVAVEQLAPNAGAFGESSIGNGALCLTWRTQGPGTSARSHTLLPLTVELVQPDRQTLQASYFLQAASHAQFYLDKVNSLASPDGGLCVAAVVHRSRAGRPLPAATWEPVLAGDASVRVGTIARRIRRRGQIPPF
jgi:hypothetical protein